MARDGLKPEETPREGLQANMYDSPSESFLLSEEAKINWLGSNTFFHRKDSIKSTDSSSNNNNNNNTGSLRSNLHSADFESRACSIIGLPKLRRPSKKDHRKKPSTCLFLRPDRSNSNSIEPRSPKVTCIGRVRSRRGQDKAHHPEEPVSRTRTGWPARLCNLFLSGCKAQQAVEVITWSEPRDAGGVDSIAKQKQRGGIEVKPRPPCLAETKRIGPGRRSASWDNDLVFPD